MLGGSMSSRLFQNVREKRGLAYAVFSGLSAYRDAGIVTIYAGCANDAVGELIDVVVAELRRMKRRTAAGVGAAARQGSPQGQPDAEPREHVEPDVAPGAAGDLLRPAFGLDETLDGVERVTTDDVQRVARRSVRDGALAATVLGCRQSALSSSRRSGWLCWDDSALHQPRDGRIWSDQRRYETWLEVELAAADAMARAGIVPADAARDIRGAARVRHRPDRRDRAGHPARRHRVHDGGRRARRPGGALAAFRPDLVGRRRHRAGAADARGVRPDPAGPRRADAGRARRAPTSIGARR